MYPSRPKTCSLGRGNTPTRWRCSQPSSALTNTDARVRDFTGPRWDATAFWCLFGDSLAGVQSSHLRGEEATVPAMADTLGSAGPNDTVSFWFAGHDTCDYRLIAHGARRGAIADTAIRMQDVASAFKGSEAQATFCMLDCCFSSGAWAESSTTLR
jgi:helicase